MSDRAERALWAMSKINAMHRQAQKNIRRLKFVQRVTRSKFGQEQVEENERRIRAYDLALNKIIAEHNS